MTDMRGVKIHVSGIVQGVGFRPFVYGLAVRLGLNGWVRNTSAGVDIQVDGTASSIDAFVNSLKSELHLWRELISWMFLLRQRTGLAVLKLLVRSRWQVLFSPFLRM